MGRLDDKVALITGAARGQGRSHAVRLAEEGASIIAIDVCAPADDAEYSMPGVDDLAETARLVRDAGASVCEHVGDVRDKAAMERAVAAGVRELGPVDVICANAGVFAQAPVLETTEAMWRNVIDVNLTGVVHTVQAGLPSMLEARRGGSIILTSSTGRLKGFPNSTAYAAAKHGVVGLMRSWANELGPQRIRVNSIHPSAVPTPMLRNEGVYKRFRPDLENPTLEDAAPAYQTMHVLPIPWLEEIDISNALLWLASDEARYVTGVALPVDAGFTQRI